MTLNLKNLDVKSLSNRTCLLIPPPLNSKCLLHLHLLSRKLYRPREIHIATLSHHNRPMVALSPDSNLHCLRCLLDAKLWISLMNRLRPEEVFHENHGDNLILGKVSTRRYRLTILLILVLLSLRIIGPSLRSTMLHDITPRRPHLLRTTTLHICIHEHPALVERLHNRLVTA